MSAGAFAEIQALFDRQQNERLTTGFFTDPTVCIGCKACEVACREWNQLPANPTTWSGHSYDHTQALGASTWRHVKFLEQPALAREPGDSKASGEWLFFSDVCKHCEHAGCLEACPTGAIFRTEFGSVVVQEDVCNGCGYCVVNCPFGVIERRAEDGRAFKCTLCYDRQRAGRIPACAHACPTDAIQFGEWQELQERAQARLGDLQKSSGQNFSIYDGKNTKLQGLHSIFLAPSDPALVGLPQKPHLPTDGLRQAWGAALSSSLFILLAIAAAFLIPA